MTYIAMRTTLYDVTAETGLWMSWGMGVSRLIPFPSGDWT